MDTACVRFNLDVASVLLDLVPEVLFFYFV